MSKCQEKQIIINKIWSNLPPNHSVNNVNNFEGPSSAINPFKLVKSREKHSELIIAAHSNVALVRPFQNLHLQCGSQEVPEIES